MHNVSLLKEMNIHLHEYDHKRALLFLVLVSKLVSNSLKEKVYGLPFGFLAVLSKKKVGHFVEK